MTRRSRVLGFGFAALLIVAGAIGIASFGGTLGQVVSMIALGLGLVLAVSLVFLEVGLSEDRERAMARSEQPRRRPRRTQRSLDRMRGRQRRL
jgi:hypothetical protein